jgi:hypothetical protein
MDIVVPIRHACDPAVKVVAVNAKGDDVELEHIAELSSADTGGGITVDLVKLRDGRVLGISEDAIVLYRDLEDFEDNSLRERPTIPL